MRVLYLITLFLSLSLTLWFPARHEATVFESIVIRETLKIERETGLPPKRLTQQATAGLLAVYDAAAGWIPGFELRPEGPAMEEPEFRRMQEAGRKTLQTPFFRSLRSFSMMVLQRYGVILAAFLLFLPFTVLMLVDGLVHRRIRAARLQAPRPSLWRGAVTVMAAVVSAGLILPMIPALPVHSLVLLPLIGALALRVAAASWHRFL